MGDLTTLATAKEWLALGSRPRATRSSRGSSQRRRRLSRSASATRSRAAVHRHAERQRQAGDAVPRGAGHAVASLTIDGVAIPARTSPTGSGYTFDEDFLLLCGYCFTRGPAERRAGDTAGYAATPKDLEQAVLEILALKFKERERIGVSSKTLAGETISFFRNVSSDTMAVIDSYRRVVPV
jgi:hypothetical protein